jgi:hypothetical protein
MQRGDSGLGEKRALLGARYASVAALLVMGVACSASNSGEPTGNRGGSGNAGGSGGSGATGSGGEPSTGGTGAVGSGAEGGSSGSTGGGAATGGMATGGVGAGGSSNVQFNWPETAPGTGQCKPGRYIGDFTGMFSPSLTIFPLPIPVAGTVDLTLSESQSGEFLEISDGHVSGLANNQFPYEADILGRVNCITRKLENGFMRNGWYDVGGVRYPFEGPVAADYDTLTYAFVNGIWDAKEPTPPYGGNGTWNAKFCPNGPPC